MHKIDQSNPNNYSPVVKWVDDRLPIFSFAEEHLANYKVPKNLSYFWSFGSLAGIALMIQIITGIFLAMHYTPHADHAFNSVEHIMRDVNYGWLIRYTHAVGASMFFVVVYAHIARGLFFGSYKQPREMLWFLGIIIFLCMMATAFMGYVLPWGQMSFWGATVITNLFSAIPIIGDNIVSWLWGGYSVDNPTLNRFFALHYLFPFIIVAFVILHLIALHIPGSNNPSGVEIKNVKKDTIPFHPYYTIKDLFGLGIFLMLFFYFVFFYPNNLGHPDNYIPADPLVTPAHIVPEWYFLPFYAILRAIPDKLTGVVFMFASILILFFLPWLDSSKVKSGYFRPLFKIFYLVFILNFVLLGYLGAQPPEGVYVILSRLSTLYYFGYFLVILPFLGKKEKPLDLPKSIDEYYQATHNSK
ncbi:MAG: cytochrome b/b6 [Rickettsiales bacterium]|jgi:quinol-cytochrome oxidoreductase complex cytochrome b subunit|nr:cytochrome b/b6 [Rickettsiales bacterium]